MSTSANRPITLPEALEACLCVVLFTSLLLGAEGFQWDWRHSEAIPLKQSLLRAKVSDAERAAIARAIAIQIRPDLGGLGGQSDQEIEENAQDALVKIVDLNGDGTPEIIVQGSLDEGCSPTGNCRFWIFQKSGQEYKLLFYREAIQSFTIEKTSSHGFSDVAVATHDSATESTVRLLQYREGTYHEAACYDANWAVLEGNTIHKLKEPRLTPCNEK